MYETFLEGYGPAAVDTGIDPVQLGLGGHPALAAFFRESGGGVFADGLLSICSRREQVADLGGWERWLPAGARLAGSTALGFQWLLAGASGWLLDCQNGQLVEVGMQIPDFINHLADPGVRCDFLHEDCFRRWQRAGGHLALAEVLNPVPALALGGDLDNLRYSATPLAIYLAFTAQLFQPNGDLTVDIWPLESGS